MKDLTPSTIHAATVRLMCAAPNVPFDTSQVREEQRND